jgi:hypothetical protein
MIALPFGQCPPVATSFRTNEQISPIAHNTCAEARCGNGG